MRGWLSVISELTRSTLGLGKGRCVGVKSSLGSIRELEMTLGKLDSKAESHYLRGGLRSSIAPTVWLKASSDVELGNMSFVVSSRLGMERSMRMFARKFTTGIIPYLRSEVPSCSRGNGKRNAPGIGNPACRTTAGKEGVPRRSESPRARVPAGTPQNRRSRRLETNDQYWGRPGPIREMPTRFLKS